MVNVVNARQWETGLGAPRYRELSTGDVSLPELLRMVDIIALTPSIEETLGEGYAGDRGWITVQADKTILHGYFENDIRIEYFGAATEHEHGPRVLYVGLETFKNALRLLDEGQDISDFLRLHTLRPTE